MIESVGLEYQPFTIYQSLSSSLPAWWMKHFAALMPSIAPLNMSDLHVSSTPNPTSETYPEMEGFCTCFQIRRLDLWSKLDLKSESTVCGIRLTFLLGLVLLGPVQCILPRAWFTEICSCLKLSNRAVFVKNDSMLMKEILDNQLRLVVCSHDLRRVLAPSQVVITGFLNHQQDVDDHRWRENNNVFLDMPAVENWRIWPKNEWCQGEVLKGTFGCHCRCLGHLVESWNGTLRFGISFELQHLKASNEEIYCTWYIAVTSKHIQWMKT